MSEIEELRARVEDLERRIRILFESTGTHDPPKPTSSSMAISPEVEDLMRRKKFRKAALLYQQETGADTGQTLEALKQLKRDQRGEFSAD